MFNLHSAAPRLPHFLICRRRTALLLGITAVLLAPAARPQRGTQVHDPTALKPPPGARIAIVEFVDMECPVCASTNPIVEKAAATYKIPLVRHDFLIPSHAWSPIAALNARWFDTKSKVLGDEYRDQVFANQPTFYNNPELLRQFTEKFAASHHISMPASVDPQGKLASALKADNDLGMRTGIEHTPTVFVVTSSSKGAPFIEVPRPEQHLYETIDQAIADTKGSAPHSK